MIKHELENKPEIDLRGPEGNAFVLLGCAKTYAKQLNLDYKKIQEEVFFVPGGASERIVEWLEWNL